MRPSRQEGCRLEKARAPACFVCACHGAASAAAYRTTTRRRHTRSCLTVFPSPGYARVFVIAWDVSSQSGSRTILHHHQPGASYYSSPAATSSLLFAPTLDDAVHSRRTHRLLQEKNDCLSFPRHMYAHHTRTASTLLPLDNTCRTTIGYSRKSNHGNFKNEGG